MNALLQHRKRLVRLPRTTLVICGGGLLPDDLVDHSDVLELVGVDALGSGQLLAVQRKLPRFVRVVLTVQVINKEKKSEWVRYQYKLPWDVI